jgi:hypothetical protein
MGDYYVRNVNEERASKISFTRENIQEKADKRRKESKENLPWTLRQSVGGTKITTCANWSKTYNHIHAQPLRSSNDLK